MALRHDNSVSHVRSRLCYAPWLVIQLASHPERRHQSTHTHQSTVSVGRIPCDQSIMQSPQTGESAPTRIQLVAVTDPVDAARLDIIEGNEVEVAWDAVEVFDTELAQSGEQVLGDVDSGEAHCKAILMVRLKQATILLMSTHGSAGNVQQDR